MHALKSLNLSQGRSPRVSSRTHEHATPNGTAYAYLHLVKQGDAVTLLNEVQPAKGVPVSGTVQLVTHADPIKSQDVRHPTATLLIVRLACTYIDSKNAGTSPMRQFPCCLRLEPTSITLVSPLYHPGSGGFLGSSLCHLAPFRRSLCRHSHARL